MWTILVRDASLIWPAEIGNWRLDLGAFGWSEVIITVGDVSLCIIAFSCPASRFDADGGRR